MPNGMFPKDLGTIAPPSNQWEESPFRRPPEMENPNKWAWDWLTPGDEKQNVESVLATAEGVWAEDDRGEWRQVDIPRLLQTPDYGRDFSNNFDKIMDMQRVRQVLGKAGMEDKLLGEKISKEGYALPWNPKYTQ